MCNNIKTQNDCHQRSIKEYNWKYFMCNRKHFKNRTKKGSFQLMSFEMSCLIFFLSIKLMKMLMKMFLIVQLYFQFHSDCKPYDLPVKIYRKNSIRYIIT